MMFRHAVLQYAAFSGEQNQDCRAAVGPPGQLPVQNQPSFIPPPSVFAASVHHVTPCVSPHLKESEQLTPLSLSGPLSAQAENTIAGQPRMKCQVAIDCCIILSYSNWIGQSWDAAAVVVVVSQC